VLGSLIFSDGDAMILPQAFPPHWASSYGQDEYGVWAAFTIDDVEQVMRWIQPGEFLMGSPEAERGRDDEKQHPVRLTQGYWLADTACSNALWQVVTGQAEGDDKPVTKVSWDDVTAWLQKLVALSPAVSFRLPTEAEWEYACRAGTTAAYSTGDTVTEKQANYSRNHNGVLPVRSFERNPWGLWQMHGNVWEWCQDWFGDYRTGQVTDPIGPASGQTRVCRGGSWIFNARRLRSAYRLHWVPDGRDDDLGFRLAAGQ